MLKPGSSIELFLSLHIRLQLKLHRVNGSSEISGIKDVMTM